VEIFVLIAAAIIILAAAFFCGPQLLELFFRKADEWAEIIDSMKDEK